MKHFILTLIAALACGGVSYAQTLKVTQGQVTTAYSVAELGDMPFAVTDESSSTSADAYSVSIGGTTYSTSSISQIAIDNSTVEASTVSVNYTESGAEVVVAADVAPYLSITATGGSVSIVASNSLSTEVTYILSGSSSNGSFYMDGKYKATLTLSDLTLTNPTGAAIYIACGKRIKINVPEGTTSTLTDGVENTQKACFFVNGHAEFRGAGTLNIAGLAKHAFASDEYTQIGASFGTLNITSAANDGLHIGQYFEMNGGTLTVSGTQGDCIDVSATDDEDDELNGQACINGGSLTLTVAADDVKGLKCDSAMTITGGSIYAEVSGLGTKGLSVGTDLLVNQTSGNATTITMDVTGTTYMPDDDELESKCRGIKVKGNFTFDGGTISMSVTGKKAKGISCDGTYTYVSGTTNVWPE